MNFQQICKIIIEVQILQKKVLGSYFFETPCTHTFNAVPPA